jgi:hypothetical protein
MRRACRHGVMRVGAIVALGLLGGGSVAAAATTTTTPTTTTPTSTRPTTTAPTLKVSVKPKPVHPGQTYTITITGSYNQKAITTIPWVITYVQYSSAACQPTTGSEHALSTNLWSVGFKGRERSSPFTINDPWKVEPAKDNPYLGTRRACVYLYRQWVPLTSTAKPLVLASAAYGATKR